MKVNVVLYSWRDQYLIPAQALVRTLFQYGEMLDPRLLALGLKPLQLEQVGSCNEFADCPCNANYLPGDCTISALCPNNCSSHGVCANGAFDRICQCDPGWQGRDCSYTVCPYNCFNHGSCLVIEGSPNATCNCDPGYAGAECQLSCPLRCSGHGTCTAPYSNLLTRRGACNCTNGFTGDDCSTVVYVPYKSPASIQSAPVPEQQKILVTVIAVVFGFILLAVIGIALFIYLRHKGIIAGKDERY